MEIIYGINPVKEALKAGRRTFTEIISSRQNTGEIESLKGGIPLQIMHRNDLGRMAGTPHHQGVIARVSSYPYTALKDLLALKTIVMLDSIEDPQNLGAIVRSAYALAEAGIVIPENRSASITPAVVKASAGATERAYIARVKNLRVAAQELKKNGFWIVGLDAQAEECIRDIPRFAQTLLVLGGEDIGIRPLVAREIDVVARIPMKGPFNSLNVAQSAAIALYELMSG